MMLLKMSLLTSSLSVAFSFTSAGKRSLLSCRVLQSNISVSTAFNYRAATTRLFSSSQQAALPLSGVSRIDTLKRLLRSWGAPGSKGCQEANDLVSCDSDEYLLDLHPLLIPIAKSESSGNYICALKTASAAEDSPLPIVESGIGLPGYKLLALNSEHLMRRIACEADFAGDAEDVVSTYNDGLGSGELSDKGLDSPYEPGSVEKLGYGVQKYVLLRVGPFPDLYEEMSAQHIARGDESSALIAAESANGKFTGFGSLFARYAKLLSSFPNREEEARDAARICLRVPLSSSGLTMDDFASISLLAGLCEEGDSTEEAIAKMQVMYEKIREHEKEEEGTPNQASGKTPEQSALDEATYLLDRTAMAGAKWATIRSELADIYEGAEKSDMAKFVDPSRN
mmetsp:Transcript_10922/g.16362  ORF Transcript_10922/g.16362 Transcript_10922/m.16362 type:complete len:397 (-) Transcript_10922:38-1228(-)